MTTQATSAQRLVVAVIGAGPAGLMAAEVLSREGFQVTVYDRMPSAGRKLLMAGRGGLNLTHSEPLAAFLERYRASDGKLAAAVKAFPPSALIDWVHGLGQETFVGSSGRVFPKAMKASPLLRAWLKRLESAGVRFRFRQRWTGWDEAGRLTFLDAEDAASIVACDAVVLALGGASWPRLGSDGSWSELLSSTGIAVTALAPSNCGVEIAWTDMFAERFAGAPLKRICVSIGESKSLGEAVVTRSGLEGGALYALSADIRASLTQMPVASLAIDLRPDVDEARLLKQLSAPRGKTSTSNHLRKAAGLSPVAIGLLYEAALRMPEGSGGGAGNLRTLAPEEIARLVKSLPLDVVGLSGIDRAISSAGGVRLDEVDENFMLRTKPGVFVAGEMLDWEAPTGGYLLQACFATGVAAARGVITHLREGDSESCCIAEERRDPRQA